MRLRVSPSCFLPVEGRRSLCYRTDPKVGQGLCAAECSGWGGPVLSGKLDPSGIYGSSGGVLGRFCRWFGQVWEMCVQVSCLWEQEHHLCIPACSKAGPRFCCTINITLAMHSRTDDLLVYHEYLLLFYLYFLFHFHAEIWWGFVWFILFSETLIIWWRLCY